MTADQPSPERMRIMAVGGRSLRVSVREGAPGWTPLLLCNGIGVSLELFQPFVDALDQRRPGVRVDLAGVRRLVLAATGPGALMVPARPAVLLRMLSPRRHRDPGYAARVAAHLYG